MVALAASAAWSDEKALGEIAEVIGSVCRDRSAGLVLGGAGAWPVQPSHGVWVSSFAAFHDYLPHAVEQP
jgi:hypothetical protein